MAFLLPILGFGVEGRLGLSLADEGFLWYGAQRVSLGEIPLRDFESYDIARYFWSASVMRLLQSDGIVALRISDLILVGIAVFVLTMIVGDSVRSTSTTFLGLAAMAFFMWMWPPYKIADFFATTILLGGISALISRPTAIRHLLCGVAVGFAAVIGRNHGVYGFLAGIAAIYYVHRRQPGAERNSTVWFLGGVGIGFSPNVLLCILAPGFSDALVESVTALFSALASGGSTNIPKPWPKPWWVNFKQPLLEVVSEVLIGPLLLLLPSFGVVGLAVSFYSSRSPHRSACPAFVAASMLALPYSHYAWSRPDEHHLFLGSLPLIVGVLTFPWIKSNTRTCLSACFAGLGVLATLPDHPIYLASRDGNWRDVMVATDLLTVDSAVASDVELLNRLSAPKWSPRKSILAVPYWPGAYAILGQKSPTWRIYPITAAGRSFQLSEIEKMKHFRPDIVIIKDTPLDGRDASRYSKTHPEIYQYVLANYAPYSGDAISGRPALRIFERAVAPEIP